MTVRASGARCGSSRVACSSSVTRSSRSTASAADRLRVREAADVAALVGRVLGERWPVFERETKEWRDARLGDICILLPARTSLGFLERSLDDAGIPYRAETSSLVYGSREI